MRCELICLLAAALLGHPAFGIDDDAPIYERDVAPLLTKYCAGCHNAQEAEADTRLDSFKALMADHENGPLIRKGNSHDSRLIQLIEGTTEPSMPPEDEPAPSEQEIGVLRAWIDGGIRSDPSMSNQPTIELKPAPEKHHLVSSAANAHNRVLLGKLGRVEAIDASGQTSWTNLDLEGKANAIRTSQSGKIIAVGGGRAGLAGQILLLDPQGKTLRQLRGHLDSVYSVAISPDDSIVASGSYDHSIILWNASTGERLFELSGHNGAIYDLDFDPTGRVLATASADQTVKLWNVESGQRLDTLGQPEGEMYCVRFGPDGSHVYAAGSDKQIRKWRISSHTKPSISPMVIARYAAEDDILLLSVDENQVITTSADKTAKSWSVQELQPLGTLCSLDDDPVGLTVTGAGQGYVVDIHGQQQPFTKSATPKGRKVPERDLVVNEASKSLGSELDSPIQEFQESEPNDGFSNAAKIDVPAKISGTIYSDSNETNSPDQDLYRFSATAGETWLIEAQANGKDSRIDSFVDILDERGQSVVRCRLQALRETYFTFRGKDSTTSDDFRLHRWEDMELDEYIYANGEVNRLWLYPRGPDSGFKVYPGSGSRYNYFGTTALSHALGEPAYIVRELDTDEVPLPNGLPVFTIYYENDDDGLRKKGKNSRLQFTAPNDGDYFVRLRDARGFEGEDFGYQLVIRKPAPSFEIKVTGNTMKIPGGGGREWKVEATRIDGFEGPISVNINGLPDYLLATNPLIIEGGQQSALGAIYTEQPSTSNEPLELSLTATAVIQGQTIVKELSSKLVIELVEGNGEIQMQLVDSKAELPIEELEIRPGETISAKLLVTRNGEKKRIGFGKEDAGRNLPHGAFVDNIGLNGLLIPEQQTEREFFITAAPKTAPGKRQFHLKSDTKGKPTSRPIWLNVLAK